MEIIDKRRARRWFGTGVTARERRALAHFFRDWRAARADGSLKYCRNWILRACAIEHLEYLRRTDARNLLALAAPFHREGN